MATIGVFLTISAGLFFYWLRCRFRFCYGLCEIAVAMLVISLTFFPPFTALAADDVSALGSLMSNGAGILGGIYIFVRGMDNVDQDLPPTWRPMWNSAFPKYTRHF